MVHGKIVYVGMAKSKVTDADPTQLRGLEFLENIDLGDSQITDATLVHLKAIENLEELAARNTRITDAGLEHLAHMKILLSFLESLFSPYWMANFAFRPAGCNFSWLIQEPFAAHRLLRHNECSDARRLKRSDIASDTDSIGCCVHRWRSRKESSAVFPGSPGLGLMFT